MPAGYGWSFPAGNEMRIGVGSFDPRFHVKDTTVELAEDLERDAVRYQGNWIPHRLRPAAEDDVFFAGDSAGHCLPLTAEGIRTAFYFGIACGRELRAVVEGRPTRARRCGATPSSAPPPLEVRGDAARAAADPARAAARTGARDSRDGSQRFVDWSFAHYLQIAPPSFAAAGPAPRSAGERVPAAAWALGVYCWQ